MTNTYGTEPHNHDQGHDEVLTPEHDAVREPPSDYEFADEHSASVAEEHTEEHQVAASETKARGRSAALPIVAAVGGVLLLGVVAWWQFGGNHSAQPAMPVLSSQSPSSASAVTDAPKTDFPSSTVTPTTSSVAQTADAAPIAANPSTAMAPIPASSVGASAAAVPVAANPVSPSAQAPANGAEDRRIDALNSRIDDLQKSLDQATQQLGQVTNMVSATAATGASAKDLQDRLDKIEQQLLSLHHSAPKSKLPETAPVETPMAAVTESKAPVAVKSKTHHATAKATHKPTPPKAVAEAPAPSWILRAASPGQAWVATSAAAHELKQVQIGDTLEGIGKVTAISQNNGNWVVQGTKGVIQ